MMGQALLSVTSFLASMHWIFAGIANSMVLFVIARLIMWVYHEHSYLYQFEDRTRLFDAWIDFTVPFVKRLKLQKYREVLVLYLGRSGMRRDWGPNHFIASQIVFGGAVFVTALVLGTIVLGASLVWPIAGGLLAAVFPFLKLQDTAAKRFRSCNRDLPFALDYLVLAMGAGLDFNQSLKVVVDDAPPSPLMDEFSLVLRNMRLGLTRADALIEMERRLESPNVKLFVQTLVQGMELGTDIGRTMASMSTIMQTKRFQAAEEAAGKISVRMMIPMMMFVMPSVMIVLLGPMMLAYLQSGS